MNILSEFTTLMMSGGFLMWVIFIAAFSAFALIIWQAVDLHFKTKKTHMEYSQLINRLHISLKKNNTGPIAEIVRQLLISKPKSSIETGKIINIQLAEIIPRLAGNLPTISIIASLLPMLGLLGTVTGMINVFEVIAIHGSGKPEAMAEGISQALLTTASGLIFAIPVIFLHHLLVRKVDSLITLLGKAAQVMQQATLSQLADK
jgi:biopolymer transport protein ExbB